MGKQVGKKQVGSAVKKSSGTRLKSPSLVKKSERKKAENSISVDLLQPKDRDPIQERVDLIIPDLHKLYEQGFLTSDIIELAVDYSNRHEMGNELFRAWYDDYLEHWNQPCSRFDDQFNDHFGSHTCESKVEEIFHDLDNSWDQVFRFLITCFDIDNVEKYSTEYMWSVRCLGMRVAQQEPFSFFDINAISNPDKSPHSTYWASEVSGNPRLTHEFPMGAFWLMCSMIFDHPWTHTYNANRDTDDEYLITSREVCNIRDSAYAQLKQLNEMTNFPVFSAPKPKKRTGEKFFIQELNQDMGVLAVKDEQKSPIEEPLPAPTPDEIIKIQDTDDEEDDVEIMDDSEDDSSTSDEEDQDEENEVRKDDSQTATEGEVEAPTVEGTKRVSVSLTTKAILTDGWGFQKLESEEGVEGPTQSKVSQSSRPGGDATSTEAMVNKTGLIETTDERKTASVGAAVEPPVQPSIHTEVVTTSNEDEAISEMTGTTGAEKENFGYTTPARSTTSPYHKNEETATKESPMKVDGAPKNTSMHLDSPPKYKRMAHPGIPAPTKLASRFFKPSTTSTTKPITSSKKRAKIKKKMSVSERLVSYRQVNLDGIEGDARYFEVSFAMMFTGKQSGGSNLAEAWHRHVSDLLGEVITDADHGLRILPVADDQYKDPEKWIRSKADLKRLIPKYRDLGKYMDKEFQNGPYLLSNSKDGEKKWRTRMLFGFDSGVKPEVIQNYLHESFKTQGRYCGAFPSPLQFGAIEKIGALCFYPREIDARSLEKEIMRKFGWKVPIGLRLDWVSMPYDNRTKWNERSPGLMIWHVYVRVKDSHHVDMILRQWFHPSTPKSELPWAAVVVYISDWKAAQRGTISVRAYGPVKEQILTMVSKNRDFQDLTVVLYADIEIPGMLKKAPTRLFGESTLLKLLLSIKATPAQADKAAAMDTEGRKGATNKHNTVGDDDDEDSDDEEGFTKVKTSGSRHRKNKDPSLSSLLGEMDRATPAQIKAAAEADRKRQRDLDNHRPSPLFLMVLPGEMLGSYIFVCRIKYQTLAQNVLNGLVPFFTFHLQESFDAINDKILAKWLSKSAVHQARRRNLYWCTKELRAREANSADGHVDEGLEFLDDFGEDPTDVFDGTLEFDLEMADAKDIDDGATVAGALDDLRERESQLDDAYAEIAVKDTQLEEERQRSLAKEAELLAEQKRNADLAAMVQHLLEEKNAGAPSQSPPAVPQADLASAQINQPQPVDGSTQPLQALQSLPQSEPQPALPTVSPAEVSMQAPPPKPPSTGKRPTPPSPAHSVTQNTATTVASASSTESTSSRRTSSSSKSTRRKLHPYFSKHPEAQASSDQDAQPRAEPAAGP